MESVAPPRPLATLVAIGANVLVFVAMVGLGASATDPDTGTLLRFGANNGLKVVFEGQWWRPLTAMFLHVGVVHLAVNMYSLWQLGSFVEQLMGRWLTVSMYLLTGLAGSFVSILWDPVRTSAGASGAIFGLFGVVIGYAVRARAELGPAAASLRSSILTTLVLNLAFTFTNPQLDNAAHLGGLAAGILAGFMATASALEGDRTPTMGSQAIVVAVVLGLGVLAGTKTTNSPDARFTRTLLEAAAAAEREPPDLAEVKRLAGVALSVRDDPRAHSLRAWAELRQDDPAAALVDLDAAVAGLERRRELRSALPGTLLNRGAVLAKLDKLPQAEADFTRALAAEDSLEGHAGRAWVLLRMGRHADAQRDFTAALAKSPDDATLQNNAAWNLVQQGEQLDEAVRLATAAITRMPKAAAYGTRCWAYASLGRVQEALQDCRVAVEKGASLADQGMLAFLEGDDETALEAWATAAASSPEAEREVGPWLAKAKARAGVEKDQ